MIHRLTYAEDTSRVFAIELFGFWRSGVINMTVFDYAKPPQAKHQMDLGIFVRKVRSQADAQTLVEESKTVGRCLMNSPENLYTVRLREQRDWKHRSRLLRTVRPGQEGLYLIAFSRCDRDPEANPISFKLDAEFSNPGSIVGDVNYLSAGMTGLPKLYALLFIVYIVMMLRWRSHLRAHAAKVHAIHHIMTLLVALKMLQMLFESIRYHFIQLAGVAPTWSAVFFFFTFLKSMTMFTVILLIGTGWSLLKHHITEREKNIIAGVLVLQVIDNLALVAVQSSSPGSQGWITWHDILHLVDIMCCCAILFPIVWSIRHLRQAAGADGKAAQNLQKLAQFRQFYIAVVVYIYFTRIAVFLLGATLPFQLAWLRDFFQEGATVVFYSAVGYKFRPGAENPYMLVTHHAHHAQDDDELGLIMNDDGGSHFELSHVESGRDNAMDGGHMDGDGEKGGLERF